VQRVAERRGATSPRLAAGAGARPAMRSRSARIASAAGSTVAGSQQYVTERRASAVNLKHHARYEPLFHFVAFPLLTMNLVHAIKSLFMGAPEGLHGVALAVRAGPARMVRARFPAQGAGPRHPPRGAVAPARAGARTRGAVGRITPGQWTALRFAGDDELPGLVRQVLDGKLTTGAEIKKAIVHWRADHLRV
jgi:hypothetical protein